MNRVVEKLEAQGIHPYASEQALRQEAHVARFLAREYQTLIDSDVTLKELGVSTDQGTMCKELREIVESHYDEKIEIFESFLDTRYLAYTMAFYSDVPKKVVCSTLSLEEAQENKFRLICDRIGIEGDERILNLGCGFGPFERYLLQNYPHVKLTGVNPSVVQTDYIRACIADPDCIFSHQNFTLIQQEFSEVTEEKLVSGSFDIVSSIGLIEHIQNMEYFNERVACYLKPGGKAFHHFISSKITIPQFLDVSQTLIGEYYPDGHIWPLGELGRYTKHLDLEHSWFINGMNYWRTLDEWHRRFWKNIEMLNDILTVQQIRHWNDYFILSKACFLPMEGTVFGNGQYLFRKPV